MTETKTTQAVKVRTTFEPTGELKEKMIAELQALLPHDAWIADATIRLTITANHATGRDFGRIAAIGERIGRMMAWLQLRGRLRNQRSTTGAVPKTELTPDEPAPAEDDGAEHAEDEQARRESELDAEENPGVDITKRVGAGA